MEQSSQKILLTYGSTTLREKDISYLQPKQWLNDAIINFYYEYLGKGLPKTVVLMDPCAVAQL